jgi:hypothetical protein
VRSALEALLGARGEWSGATCRALFDVFMAQRAGRGRSATHELSWLRLVGWCLRPGTGAPGDGARMRAMWQLYGDGLAHPSKGNWGEWWILWRRVAPGLEPSQQQRIFDDVRAFFTNPSPNAPRAPGQVELLQTLAALERLPPAHKEAAGEWFMQRAEAVGTYLPIGRLGARVPLHGGGEHVVRPDVAQAWLEKLLALDWKRANGAAFAAALIARISGDAARDVPPELRRTVAARLEELSGPPSWVDMVTHASALSSADVGRVLGEALPAGLRLT